MRPTLTLAALLLAAAACSAAPAPPARPPAPDAHGIDATPEAACEALGRLGCPEAKGGSSSCPEALRRTGELQDMRVGCLASARSRAELAVCGTVRCVP